MREDLFCGGFCKKELYERYGVGGRPSDGPAFFACRNKAFEEKQLIYGESLVNCRIVGFGA